MAELRDILSSGLEELAVKDINNDGTVSSLLRNNAGDIVGKVQYSEVRKTVELLQQPTGSGASPYSIFVGEASLGYRDYTASADYNIPIIHYNQASLSNLGLYYMKEDGSGILNAPYIPYIDPNGGSLVYFDSTNTQKSATLGDPSTGFFKNGDGWQLVGAPTDGRLTTGVGSIDGTYGTSTSEPSGVSGDYGACFGSFSQLTHDYTFGYGVGLKSAKTDSVILGMYNTGSNTAATLVVGIGSDDSSRQDGLYVYATGAVEAPSATITQINNSNKNLTTVEYLSYFYAQKEAEIKRNIGIFIKETVTANTNTTQPLYNTGSNSSFVFHNGYLLKQSEYSFVSRSEVSLTTAPASGDTITNTLYTDEPIYTEITVASDTTIVSVNYNVDNILVFVEGAATTDYTATTGTDITFNFTITAGQTVTVIDYSEIPNIVAQTTTASGGETSINFTHKTNSVLVFKNGVLLDISEYDASDPQVIGLTTAAAANDVYILATFYKGYDLTETDSIDADASAGQTVFPFNYIQEQVEVYVNGAIKREGTDYSADNGQTITFNAGLTSGDWVHARTWRY